MQPEKRFRVHWRLKHKKTESGFPVERKSDWMTEEKAIRCYEKCVAAGYEARIGEFMSGGILPMEFISHTDNWTVYRRDGKGQAVAKTKSK